MQEFVINRDVWSVTTDLVVVDSDAGSDVIAVSSEVSKTVVILLKTIEKLNARIEYLESKLDK